MRADRLIQLLLLLQGRGQVTAREAADVLEVSVATARRDLEALSSAGVPVYARPGRGGGWALLGGSRTNLTGLTQPEADALFALVGSAPPGTVLDGALRKLVRALPEPFRDDAAHLSAAMLADGAGWGRTQTTEPAVLAELHTLLARRRRIAVDYTDSAGNRSTRTVDPWGLVDKAGTWYLVTGAVADAGVAADAGMVADTATLVDVGTSPDAGASHGGRRVLRVDRIAGMRAVGARSEPPDGFDLEAQWRQFVTRTEQLRGPVSATAAVVESAVGPFLGLMGRNARLRDDVLVPGRRTVEVTSTSVEMLARQVAGWSGLVEVLDPSGVRAELARMGTALKATYGTAVSSMRL